MPCLKCGGKVDSDALVCDKCADSSFQEARFFLNPVLVGSSLIARLRSMGSAACLLGPNTGSDIAFLPSSDIVKSIKDMNVQSLGHDQAKGFFQKCDVLLAHLGVPLNVDQPQVLLTEDAAEAITVIVQKVNAVEKMFPLEGVSDLYIRMGIVYWFASKGILIRAASKRWSTEKRKYLVGKSKEFLSKVDPGDDLYSIAVRTLGLLSLDAEEWTDAEEHLAGAIKHFPNDIIIGEGLARSHLMLGNQMEALSRVDEVMNIEELPELWVLKGRILRDLDRPKEAIDCFSRAISLDSHYMPAHDILVETYRDMGKLEQAALAESQRSLSRRPDLERQLNALMKEFAKVAEEERPPTPSRPVERADVPKPTPEPPPRLDPIDEAKKALDTKEYDTAIQKAKEILREKPDMRDATLVLIEGLVAKGQLQEASDTVHTFYEKNRNDAHAWYWRGVVSAKEGKWGASVQYFSKAVSLDPKFIEAWVAMGEELLLNAKAPGADESFTKALELDPENSRAWLGRGKAMYALNRWGAAIQSLDKYNSLMPGDTAAWKMKADILFEKEKFKRAVDAYDKYISLAGDDSYALGRKGISLNAIGMLSDAKKCLEEAVRLDPNNKEAEKWLKTLRGEG